MVMFSRKMKIVIVIFLLSIISLIIIQTIKTQYSKNKEFYSRNESPWLMYRYDAEHTGYNSKEKILTKENVHNLRLAWNFGNNAFFATPTTVNNTVFIGELQSKVSQFYALGLDDGKFLWKANMTPLNKEVWDRGIIGSATFDEGIIFIGNNEAVLYAINATDGSIIWEKNLNNPVPSIYHQKFPYLTDEEEHPEFPATEEFYLHHDPDAIMTSPLVVGSKVIVGIASNTGDLPCSTGRIIILNKYTGEIIWTTLMVPDRTEFIGEEQLNDEDNKSYEEYNFGAGVWATPVYDKEMNRLYVGTGNPCGDINKNQEKYPFNYAHSVLALDLEDGHIIWVYTKSEYDGQDLDFGSSPLIFNDENGIRYVGALSKGGDFVAIRTDVIPKNNETDDVLIIRRSDLNGDRGWEVKIAPASASPHDGGGVNSPSFIDGRIFVGVGKRAYAEKYTGENKAAFLVLNPSDGSIEMEYDLKFTMLGASAGANHMIFFSDGNSLAVLDTNSRGKNPKPLWSSSYLESAEEGPYDYVQPLLGGISISNGYVVVGSVNTLYAFSVR